MQCKENVKITETIALSVTILRFVTICEKEKKEKLEISGHKFDTPINVESVADRTCLSHSNQTIQNSNWSG